MEDTGAQHTVLPGHAAERRTRYRIPMRSLGGAAMLQAEEGPDKAILGRLVDLSAGGCCLVAARSETRDLNAGDHCIVTLPATKQGLPYPATLIDLEAEGESADDVLLRFRFRQADPIVQQRLTRWLAELSVMSWHARAGEP